MFSDFFAFQVVAVAAPGERPAASGPRNEGQLVWAPAASAIVKKSNEHAQMNFIMAGWLSGSRRLMGRNHPGSETGKQAKYAPAPFTVPKKDSAFPESGSGEASACEPVILTGLFTGLQALSSVQSKVVE
jgi:hypothetical protein